MLMIQVESFDMRERPCLQKPGNGFNRRTRAFVHAVEKLIAIAELESEDSRHGLTTLAFHFLGLWPPCCNIWAASLCSVLPRAMTK
jgi:hypothetical protein